MFRRVVVGSSERGLVIKNRQLHRIIGPGVVYLPWRWLPYSGLQEVILADLSAELEIGGEAARQLRFASHDVLNDSVSRINAETREVVVVYAEGVPIAIVTPGTDRLFWNSDRRITTKRFDIMEDIQIPAEIVRDLDLARKREGVLLVAVPEQHVAILRDGGAIIRVLQCGSYGFWSSLRSLSVDLIDLRITSLDISGQEMLTRDKVSLRLTLSLSYRVRDPMGATSSTADLKSELYRMAQLALRQAVSAKTLDELLEHKDALNGVVHHELQSMAFGLGVETILVGVKDIILLGDMRVLFNQVVEAEKAAQANNIRRREETAATRSLLNTAKIMENNPILLRLKELEAIERISENVDTLTVNDGLRGVMRGLVSLEGAGRGG